MKRSFVGILCIFISAGGVLATPLSLKLDLDVKDEVNFKIENEQLDGLFYRHFTPKFDQFVNRVCQSNLKVWESDGYGRVVYALLGMADNVPNILYLKVDYGFSVEYKYYKKELNQWVDSDLCEYEKLVDDLRKSVKLEGQFTLDVFQPVDDKYYSIQYSSKDRPYTYITPKAGYFAKSVKFLKETLWSAQKFGDRCVAVWAYLIDGKYYMVRLLVTRYTQESEILTFYLKDGLWELVDSMDGTHKNKYAQKPANFMYPNYKFNFAGTCRSDKDLGLKKMGRAGKQGPNLKKEKKTPEGPKVDKTEDSPLDMPKESYFDTTGDYYKFNIHDSDEVDDESTSSESFNPEKEVDKTELATEIDDSEVLHLSDPTTRRTPVDLRCVDNVLYKIYRLYKNMAPAKVVDSSGTVWTARTKAERCVYLTSAQSHGNPYALYLIIEVGSELRAAYFLKVKDKWAKTNLEQYKTVIEHLKKSERKYEVAIDISKKVQNVNATVTYNNLKSPNYMFLPKKGYVCSSVTFKDMVIWSAVEGERCVALWSYECFDKPYYIRMVVTDKSGKSNLISHLNANGKWELFSSYNESRVQHLVVSGPSNFFNPEYEFNQLPEYGVKPLNKSKSEASGVSPVPNLYKETLVANTSDSAGVKTDSKRKADSNVEVEDSKLKRFKGSDSSSLVDSSVKAPETTETKVDSLSDNSTSLVNRKETTLAEYRPVPRSFDPNMVLSLDLLPEVRKMTDELYTVFDNRLKLVTYHPPPGYYFDLITHSKNQLFWGTVDTTLCYSVNLYLKDDYYYLCDLLLRNRDHDMTVYFKLEDELWVTISKKEYMESIDELKSQASKK